MTLLFVILTDDGLDVHALPRRPGSSRYHILPSIGQSSPSPGIADEPSLHTVVVGQKAGCSAANNSVDASLTSHGRLQMTVTEAAVESETESGVSGEVKDVTRTQSLDDEQVLLAVKIPTGQRIERRFHCNEKLFNVLRYVETVAQEDFTNCQFVTADSRTVLSDLSQTIASCAIVNRSVLYLQLPAET